MNASCPISPRNTAPNGRALELQDWLNRHLYHPLAARLARLLVPTGISPNAVSVGGAIVVWAAAWAYAAIDWPVGALLGLALHMIWHVIDGADGDLARLTGRASPRGEIVDGMCDYAAHIVLYLTLAAIFDDEFGTFAWIIAVAAGASHAFQANHAESQRRSYLWWTYGLPWLKQVRRGDRALSGCNRAKSAAMSFAGLYLKVARWMAPQAGRIDAIVSAAAADPDRTAHIRRLVRRSWRKPLAYEKLLGANPRTILLGASMLAGSPVWYFLTEIVLLNLVLFASIREHNRVSRKLAERLA